MSDDTPDLSFITTDALIAELQNRHTGTVIAYAKHAPKGHSETDSFFEYSGGLNQAIGLAHRALHEFTLKASRDIIDASDLGE